MTGYTLDHRRGSFSGLGLVAWWPCHRLPKRPEGGPIPVGIGRPPPLPVGRAEDALIASRQLAGRLACVTELCGLPARERPAGLGYSVDAGCPRRGDGGSIMPAPRPAALRGGERQAEIQYPRLL